MQPEPSEDEVQKYIIYWATQLFIRDCDDEDATEEWEQLQVWLSEYERIAGVNLAYLPQWLEEHRLPREAQP